MDTPWSQLSNAHLIDWMIESLKTDPEKWNATCDAAWDAAWNAARDAAWDATLNADLGAAWDAAWNAARNAIWDAPLNAARNAIWNAARDVILALVAYDDCDEYLSMSYEQLLTYAVLSERPQAILLLSLKWIQEHEQTLV